MAIVGLTGTRRPGSGGSIVRDIPTTGQVMAMVLLSRKKLHPSVVGIRPVDELKYSLGFISPTAMYASIPTYVTMRRRTSSAPNSTL